MNINRLWTYNTYEIGTGFLVKKNNTIFLLDYLEHWKYIDILRRMKFLLLINY